MKPKNKLELSESEKDATVDYEDNSNHSRQEHRFYETERKKIKKIPHISSNRLSIDQHPKVSTNSNYSKINNSSDTENFRSNQSAYFHQLTQKYVQRGAPQQKMREQMQLALQRKSSQIEALLVHRDELKFISINNSYDVPIKISLALLKQKAKTEQKVKDMKHLFLKDTKQLDRQINMMTDYYNFITNSLKTNGQDDLIMDIQQEEKLMIENLYKENDHLFRELKQEDKKNAKEIRKMQEEIGQLRVYIKQKEDKIRDLKSKICFIHIKLHSRGSNSKQKNMSLSVRKFIIEKNDAVHQVFVGNSSFKNYSKQILEKVSGQQQLIKIRFYYDSRRQILTFKCIYRKNEGKIHYYDDEIFHNEKQHFVSRNEKTDKPLEIYFKHLLSFKFYFKSKIVGIQCRLKSDKGTQNVQAGNCSSQLEHELLTLVNKRVVTLGSYWHHKEMIGLGIWYGSKNEDEKLRLSKQTATPIKEAKSAQKLQINQDYYT